jgi:hypothetical protein
MAFLSESFDVNAMPAKTGGNFEPLPAGWYTATISQAELKDTKAGTGQYIKLRYDITGPSHQGRVVFGNLNIKNPSPEAEKIGRADLGEIMRAIGLGNVSDTDQLIGGQLGIKLAIKEDAQYGASNEVKGFKSLTGSVAPSAMATTSAPAPAAAKSAAPPWAKK